MIGFIIAQVVDNFASQPIIFSKTTKSHPLEIFLIIIIGGLLAGPSRNDHCSSLLYRFKSNIKRIYL